jgi:hypothetical protein
MNDAKLISEINNIVKTLDSNFGIIISINDKIIYEKYIGNNKKTRFRIFSCSKPITALAIMILVQMKKIKLSDTIDKFCINIPNNNKITILHLLQHTSGVYDFSSELYFELNPKKIFYKILDKKNYETEFVDFETTITEINKKKPKFTPLKDTNRYEGKNYNNTGYDLLGYIIYVASGMKTEDFIKKNIYKPLKMNDSGFQSDKHKDESIPYDNNKNRGYKEQQNWFCGNAYCVCTIRDYNKFLSNYEKLLNFKYLKIYKKLYYFNAWGKMKVNNIIYNYFSHGGAGDFNVKHSKDNEEYFPLSRTISGNYIGNKNKINIIISENYRNKNGFFTNNFENFNNIFNMIFTYSSNNPNIKFT